MIYPTKVEVNGHIYPINTDYRYGLACMRANSDSKLTKLERFYAILTILLGPDVLTEDEPLLMPKLEKYLRCGKEENDKIEDIDMDYIQDEDIIDTSIRQVYGIDINKENLHWYEYNKLISGLTEECILNRVRDIRSYDLSEEKDEKRRKKIIEAKNRVALKEYREKTDKEKELDEFWDNIIERSNKK